MNWPWARRCSLHAATGRFVERAFATSLRRHCEIRAKLLCFVPNHRRLAGHPGASWPRIPKRIGASRGGELANCPNEPARCRMKRDDGGMALERCVGDLCVMVYSPCCVRHMVPGIPCCRRKCHRASRPGQGHYAPVFRLAAAATPSDTSTPSAFLLCVLLSSQCRNFLSPWANKSPGTIVDTARSHTTSFLLRPNAASGCGAHAIETVRS